MGVWCAPPTATRDEQRPSAVASSTMKLWLKCTSILTAILFVSVCVLLVVEDFWDVEQRVRRGPTAETLPPDVGESTSEQSQQGGWFVFDKTDSRTIRSASGKSSSSRVGFKWSAGAILDDFALGMSLDDDEYDDQANNYGGGVSRQDLGTEAPNQNSSGANKVQHQLETRAIDNISYSKTQKDLRDARERFEQQQKQKPPSEEPVVANKITPPVVTENEVTATKPNVSVSSIANLPANSISELNKTNETSYSKPSLVGVNSPKRSHHSSSRTRRKRRAGSIVSERGKPILNEFSFPANLVQGMRFVLMCQVLDGEPPIQIKWFKDNLDLAALLQKANQDNHQQLQQVDFGGGGGGGGAVGPAASKLISLAANDEATQHDSSAASQQLQHLDHIEMISNDELGSSLLFRKVREQHGGNYTCLASNRFGTSSYTSLMTVKVPPTWRVEPQDRESIMGEQITIDCQAVGNPNPFLRWKFASIQHDKMSPATGDFQPATTNQLQQQHLQSFKLINSNHHVQTLENGSLIIRQANKEHEGLYLCEADNGVEPSLVKQIKLIVHKQAHFLDDIQVLVQPSLLPSAGQQDLQQGAAGKSTAQKDPTLPISIQPSQLATSVKVVSLPQNTSLIRLVCSPYGDVPIQLDWLKDGHLIHTHSSGGAANSNANNDIEHGRQSGASTLSNEPSSAVGRFHVNSRWNAIRSSGGPNGLDSELLLTNLARHDAGVYTCSARNAFGQSERKLRLIVQEQPEAPTMVDVARISSRFIALRWLAPFDGNSPITKYVIEYRKQPSLSAQAPTTNQHAMSDSQPMGRSEKRMPVVVASKTNSETNLGTMMESSFSEAVTTSLRQQAVNSMVGDNQPGNIGMGLGGLDRAQIQHTVHDLEPMTTYSMRVIAVNALGQSRPSVALSLRTEEEVPATVPDLVEAVVLSSKSIKLRWTISYSLEHELIDGFFIGYRSFDSSALLLDSTKNNNGGDQLTANTVQTSGSQAQGTSNQVVERPTYTYKTIRLINQHQQQQAFNDRDNGSISSLASLTSNQDTAAPVLAPISSVTKTVPANSMLTSNTNKFGTPVSGSKITQQGEVALVVISNFEYVIGGLERNTEYTILIQCFNKKGTGPSSDPVVTKTLMHDPPEKLALIANELTENSFRLNWRFPDEITNPAFQSSPSEYAQSSPVILNGRLKSQGVDLVDGFVLTYAKIAHPYPKFTAPTKQNWAKKQQETSYESFSSPSQVIVGQHNQQADSAARISKQSPNDNNFQYNPPIQPNQLLDHQWQAIQLAPQQREHILKNLECGTWYAMKIWAFNKVGKGEPSDLVTSSTRGKAPVPPSRGPFLAVNSTQVKLNLNAWYDGGCEIEKFVVQYRARGQREWILVSNNILKEQSGVIIRDLAPATSYELLVGAQNHVNLSEAKYRFVTLDSEGKQVTMNKSFLPSFNGNEDEEDYQSGDNSMIDYTDDPSNNMRRESYAGGDLGHLTSNGSRWLLLVRNILNSPLTFLFTFCIFLVLLGLLLFHRFNNSGDTNNQTPDNANHHYHNGNSSLGTPLASDKPTLDCVGSGSGHPIGRRCSIDGMTAIFDSGAGAPLSCTTTNGSSSISTDSPGRVLNVNLPTSMNRMSSSHMGQSTYAPLDCYNSSAYFNTNPGGFGNSMLGFHANSTNGLQQQSLGNSCNANNDNYAHPDPGQHQQHAEFYSALPANSYATTTAQREPAIDSTSSNMIEHDQSGPNDRQQHLMQMLLISPQQHYKQHHPTNQQNGQRQDDYTTSMATAALTTLVRQKTGCIKSPNGTSDYNGTLFNPGNNFTLGRLQTYNQQDSFLPGEQQLSHP